MRAQWPPRGVETIYDTIIQVWDSQTFNLLVQPPHREPCVWTVQCSLIKNIDYFRFGFLVTLVRN